MRLWTIQPLTFFERLKKDEIIHCEPALSEHLGEGSFGFDFAFDWLAEQMTNASAVLLLASIPLAPINKR